MFPFSPSMAAFSFVFVLVTVLLGAVPFHVRGHGMLLKPVNRGSMWRYGYDTPVNYNDNEQYCGGQQVQWLQNEGRCGECGDNWALPRPRPAENGGKYGTGIIVAKYAPGQNISAEARITAHHRGRFEFRLCPLAAPGELETEECFAQHPVALADGSAHYPLPNSGPGNYPVELRLPDGLTCSHCVLQWTYITGNSWGLCPDGTSANGCGPQEYFRTCSDISIL